MGAWAETVDAGPKGAKLIFGLTVQGAVGEPADGLALVLQFDPLPSLIVLEFDPLVPAGGAFSERRAVIGVAIDFGPPPPAAV